MTDNPTQQALERIEAVREKFKGPAGFEALSTSEMEQHSADLSHLIELVKNKPKLMVFDWSYIDPITGIEAYARTPERAERLIEKGIKLTPVYTIDALPSPEKDNG